MPLSINSELLSSLATVREEVRGRVEELDRYRAVKAIEKTIEDFPCLDDLNRSLAGIRDTMQERLSETREYRALCTVENMMPELKGVLALLSEGSQIVSQQAVSVEKQTDAVIVAEPEAQQDAPASVEVDALEVAEIIEVEGPVAVVATWPNDPVGDGTDQIVGTMSGDVEPSAQDAEPGHPNPALSPVATGEGAPASSLAYNLAQLMVQALVPPTLPPDGNDPGKRESSHVALPQEHSAAQAAGRAA